MTIEPGTGRRIEGEWGCAPSGCGRASGNSPRELAESLRLMVRAGRGAPPLRGNQRNQRGLDKLDQWNISVVAGVLGEIPDVRRDTE